MTGGREVSAEPSSRHPDASRVGQPLHHPPDSARRVDGGVREDDHDLAPFSSAAREGGVAQAGAQAHARPPEQAAELAHLAHGPNVRNGDRLSVDHQLDAGAAEELQQLQHVWDQHLVLGGQDLADDGRHHLGPRAAPEAGIQGLDPVLARVRLQEPEDVGSDVDPLRAEVSHQVLEAQGLVTRRQAQEEPGVLVLEEHALLRRSRPPVAGT